MEEWFKEHQRDLSFRRTKDPFAVMVAEFMLQQTTVAAVEGYFPKFMARFPNPRTLAEAPEDEVLAHWAGLGYYRRARQLQAAARVIVAEHEGNVPADHSALLRLPGVGRYTAGAIASTAFEIPAPILEANTIRVFARLAGVEGMIGDTAFTKQLWDVATHLVSNARKPGAFNIAAMELGSLICRPEPLCLQCPVQNFCIAFRTGTATRIPTPAPRRQAIDVPMMGFVLFYPSKGYLVRRIPTGEWHAGMYEFPTARVPDLESTPDTIMHRMLGFTPDTLQPMLQLRYQVTHHRISLAVFYGAISNQPSSLPLNYQILPLAVISSLPMGSAQKKILKAIIEMES